ncbi:hypothetical protein [Liquorilactobacillus hordei]|uniref:hypothetical protein n=1 Tax=Liquorilactobacillus hordei TaxID=468911 RepID=UPI0039E76A1F
MKKGFILGSALSFIMLLGGCSSGAASSTVKKVGSHKIYTTKVNKIKENETHDWVLSGTTKAPNGTKIIVTPSDSDSINYGEVAAESTAGASWAKVKNGKFTVVVNPLVLTVDKEKAGKKIKAEVFAISNYNKSWTSSSVSKKIVSAAKKNSKAISLTISSKQEKYYKSLNSESSSDSSDSSSTSSSSSSSSSDDLSSYNTGITYDQLARTPKQYKGQKVTFTGEVVQVLEDSGYTELRLAVNGDSNNIILVDMKNKILNGSRVLENDLVTIYGESYGLVSYKSTQGEKITIPEILASQLKDQGTAPDDYGE